jgi:hypothetical protein
MVAVIPFAALLEFVTRYTDLLHVPYLTHPDWAGSINESIRPFGLVALVVCFILLYPLKKGTLRVVSMVLLVLCLVLMAICYWYFDTVDSIPDAFVAQNAILHWKWIYMGACVCIIVAMLATSLWLLQTDAND